MMSDEYLDTVERDGVKVVKMYQVLEVVSDDSFSGLPVTFLEEGECLSIGEAENLVLELLNNGNGGDYTIIPVYRRVWF